MKKIILLFVISFSILSCTYPSIFDRIDGNGNITTQNRESQPFSEIKASDGLVVNISQGDKESISVIADENLQEVIKTEIDKNVLKIYTSKGIDKSNSKIINVTFVSIDRIEVSSAATLTSNSVLNSTKMSIEVTSAATLTATLETKSTNIEASSAATCNIKGKCVYLSSEISSASTLNAKDVLCGQIKIKASSAATSNLRGETGILDVETSSGATINAYELKADDCILEASSGSDIKVYAVQSIKGNANSGADIKYKGNPSKVTKDTSSGGEIKYKD
jgi:hypothetical protein